MTRTLRFAFATLAVSCLLSSAARATTWTSPAPLNANATGDTANDVSPQVATDDAGHWVVVWQSDSMGSDQDILTVRSSDNGISWSAPGR